MGALLCSFRVERAASTRLSANAGTGRRWLITGPAERELRSTPEFFIRGWTRFRELLLALVYPRIRSAAVPSGGRAEQAVGL